MILVYANSHIVRLIDVTIIYSKLFKYQILIM